MLRSMYAGISGMKGMQTKLDTIGNNIANVNTSGYKKGRVTFEDMMSQNLSAAEGPITTDNGGTATPFRGGINPSQVGLGSQLGSIDNIHTQGNRQTTNRPLDLSLEGDGMFALGQNSGGVDFGDFTNADISFTRAGNFYLDQEGFIVNGSGKYLLGSTEGYPDPDPGSTTGTLVEKGRIQIPPTAESFSIQSDGTVNYVAGGNTLAAGQIKVAKFSNPAGLQKVGANEFINSNNAGLLVADEDGDGSTVGEFFDKPADLVAPGQNGAASIVSGSLEMSNVDLAEEFTEMITAQRGFQANTRIITTSDEILQELVNLKR